MTTIRVTESQGLAPQEARQAMRYGAFRGPRKHRVLQTRPTVAFGGAQVYVIGHTGLDNRNSGLKGNDLFKTEFMGFFREKLRA